MVKHKPSGPGHSLANNKRTQRHRRPKTHDSDGHSHVEQPNLRSVTEPDALTDFLAQAQLADRNFESERSKTVVLLSDSSSATPLPSAGEFSRVQQEFDKLVQVPRRPAWTPEMSASELEQLENKAFLEWRQSLAMFESISESKNYLTPYEKTIEFWRQLWRVVERSDVLVQVLDARNPLLFRCKDLENYVREVSSSKENFLLLNKADLLSSTQRRVWAEFFLSSGVDFAFFSNQPSVENWSDESLSCSSNENENVTRLCRVLNRDHLINLFTTKYLDKPEWWEEQEEAEEEEEEEEAEKKDEGTAATRAEPAAAEHGRERERCITIGFVGYPNVGKSSTLNTLIEGKKVSVSRNPGKTKHFQTVELTSRMLLCDCPGLVFPSVVSSRAEMLLNGILSVHEMTDCLTPVRLLCRRIDWRLLQSAYGLQFRSGALRTVCLFDGDSSVVAERLDPTALLNTYARNRGFMTSSGEPDVARAARYIVSDYLLGRLRYCHAPPSVAGAQLADFHQTTVQPFQVKQSDLDQVQMVEPASPSTSTARSGLMISSGKERAFDRQFFARQQAAKLAAGKQVASGSSKKHFNRNKREKLRRLYKKQKSDSDDDYSVDQ